MIASAIYFFTLLLVSPKIHSCSQSPPKPIVGMQLGGTGMHRELFYLVQFANSLSDKKCEYILEQQLPAGVYISVDQLDDLKRLMKLNAIYPPFVDIELSTEKSKSFTVLLKGTPQPTDNIKLPIHYRYHAPSKNHNKFATVEIPIPKLYIKCDTYESESIEELLETASKYKFCLNEGSINFVTQQSENKSNLSAKSNHEVYLNCGWYLIDVHFQLKTDLRADIPIGNEKSYPPILYATIIISWVISLWTVFRTHSIPRRINYKLEEQRILQNKIK
ncbi:uncharacterized protein LOC118743259 [Rhagoletis pomonella]|uniref:uncharacterized protein LOC118743259 n=1 Tax=Rhagoletis pomonella TaxID=28610 RepID=UPI00177E3272|nr:uncharacterized protein LOC118743259 [Rhagoletis pomonella]